MRNGFDFSKILDPRKKKFFVQVLWWPITRFYKFPTLLKIECKSFRTTIFQIQGLICKAGGGRIVFSGGREIKIYSLVFRDFGKHMVEKRYFQH